MSSQSRSGSVVVDTRLVGGEVSVDREGGLDGSVSHDLSLDLGDVGGDRVDALSEPLVARVGGTLSAHAGLLAARGPLDGAAGLVLSGGVVVAGGEGVGHAVLGGVVEPPSHDARSLEIVPGARGVPSVAAVAAGEPAAGQQVLGGDPGLKLLVRGDADSVAHGLDGAEGPAGAASRLVSDLLDRVALRPVLGRGELSGDVRKRLDVLQRKLQFLRRFEDSAHQSLDLLHGSAVKVSVVSGDPAFLGTVHFFDDPLLVEEQLF